jgi:hypothetical protein
MYIDKRTILYYTVFVSVASHPRRSLDSSPNSHGIISFADPYPLNPCATIFYKKGGGRGCLQPLSLQYPAPISPLVATLMDLPASVANKRLTARVNSLDATLTKNRGYLLRPSNRRATFVVERRSRPCRDVPPCFRAIPFLFKPLRTLLRSRETQLFSFQSFPHSLRKTTRGGGCLWLTNPLLGSTFQRSNRRSRSARDVPAFKLFNVFSLPRFSPSRRPVAFPQHRTSRPLCSAPGPRTIELHAKAKLASRPWPSTLGHRSMGAETGRPRPRRGRH